MIRTRERKHVRVRSPLGELRYQRLRSGEVECDCNIGVGSGDIIRHSGEDVCQRRGREYGQIATSSGKPNSRMRCRFRRGFRRCSRWSSYIAVPPLDLRVNRTGDRHRCDKHHDDPKRVERSLHALNFPPLVNY